MPPLKAQLHRDAALENISVAFKAEGLIASELSPSVPVKHETDVYHVYSRESLILPETARADGAPANKATFVLSTATYSLEEHALRDIITDRSRNNSDKAIRLDADTTEYLTEKIMLQKENDMATLVGTAANWSQTLSLTSTLAWDQNTTLSNPIIQIDTATSVIARNTGKRPNLVALDYTTFLAAKEHVSILDRTKYTTAESITESLLATLFGVSKILVARGIRNQGPEGLSESMTFIWTDMAFVAWVEPSPGLKKASALYTFTQQSFGNPFMVKRWREEELKGDWIEVSTLYQHQAVASQCAFQIVNTIQG